MKKEIKILIAMLFISMNLTAQTLQFIGNGTYQFSNDNPSWDLHFYLFDDGYHSFEANPIHQYKNTNIPALPKYYHTEGYTNDDPTENIVGVVDMGSGDAFAPDYSFQNQIELKRSWNLVNLSENYFILMFENRQNEDPISGCVEFHYNKEELFIDQNEILDNFNNWVDGFSTGFSAYEEFTDKFVWSYSNLKLGEQRFIYIPSSCLSPSLSSVLTRGVMKIIDCDTKIPANGKTDGSNEDIFNSQIYTLNSVVSNFPHDPNMLTTEPNCIYQDTLTQTIRYKLFFQNEGENPSENVFVNIISDLNFGSVNLINASYSCQLSWSTNEIRIVFDEMYIQGLNQNPIPNYDETIGWVVFDLCYSLQDMVIQDTDCINVEAHVEFDGQQPIIAPNTICEGMDCPRNQEVEGNVCFLSDSEQGFNHENNLPKLLDNNNLNSINSLEIYPNPVSNILTIKFKNGGTKKVRILNSTGKLFLDENITHQLDVSFLQNGMYILQIISKDEIQTIPFIKT